MTAGNGVVIVGASHGGSQLAASLRSDGYQETIVLLSDETDVPYQRPPLSKSFLKSETEGPQELRAAAFYGDHGIDLRYGSRAVAIDREAATVTTAGGDTVPFDRLVLATGTRARVPAIPGIDLENVFFLRTAADARRIRPALRAAQRVVIVGGGFIGLEIAGTARAFNKEVVVVEAADRLMGRAVAPEISAHFLSLHRGWGSEVLLGEPVAGIVGTTKVAAVETVNGRRIDADLVVVGIGAIPNVELAAEAGLDVPDGIAVDALLRTSDPRIFAIGDCVTFHHVASNTRLRLEAVQNALDQAKAVSKTIVGSGAPYDTVAWFWSDQGDVKLQMAGLPIGCTGRVVRGRPADGAFSVFQYAGERLIAVDSVNSPADHMIGRRLLGAGMSPTPAEVADPGTDLRALAKRVPA